MVQEYSNPAKKSSNPEKKLSKELKLQIALTTAKEGNNSSMAKIYNISEDSVRKYRKAF